MNQKQQELYEKLLKKVNEYCLGYVAEDVIAAIDALVENYETPKVDPTAKPLQALENIIETFIDKDSEDIKTVRAALKALEIIKTYYDIDEKGQLVHKVAYIWHKDSVGFDYELKEKAEEIELLKEILK